MKHWNWRVKLGVGLFLVSVVLHFAHWLIFHDAHHLFIFLVADIAFVPVEVLLVTLILHELLAAREKESMLRKLNMVIGSFFSEVGTRLLEVCSGFHAESESIRADLVPTAEWTAADFSRVRGKLASLDCTLDPKRGDLAELRDFLLTRRPFLLGLLQNPNLLEHESFTNVLWAVFHLAEELAHRGDLAKLPDSDLAHLAGDIRRVYTRLIAAWIDYLKHLKSDYPYLFSLAIRTNPFDPEATPEVT